MITVERTELGVEIHKRPADYVAGWANLYVREVPDGAFVQLDGGERPSIVLSGDALDAVIDVLVRARDGAISEGS